MISVFVMISYTPLISHSTICLRTVIVLYRLQVAISFDKTTAQPGENVSVTVTADPQSFVNLLAVDQSVLLLKSGNDISQADVSIASPPMSSVVNFIKSHVN